MPRSGVAVSEAEVRGRRRSYDDSLLEPDAWKASERTRSEGTAAHAVSRPRAGGVAGRRTVTITGQGAEGYATRNGTRPSAAQRHTHVKRHERAGFRPDRAAMWAVLLGLLLALIAATSSHAALLAAHHLLTLR